MSDYISQSSSKNIYTSNDNWVIANPIELSIKNKIERIGIKLSDWNISINRGILTGYNEAFIISTEKKNELIKKDPKSAEIIRPILRGRDIKRYEYKFAELWLISTFPSKNYDIEIYPAIKNHLLSYGIERLEQTGKTHNINGLKIKSRKKTNNKWFEIQDSINYWEEFNKQKLVWTPVNSEYRFTIIPEEYYFNNSIFMITGKNIYYLCGILNSKAYKCYFSIVHSKGSYNYGSSLVFNNIPILVVSEELKNKIEQIVKKLLEKNNSKEEINKFSSEIDKIIYSYCKFTNEEILYIKNFN